MAKYILDFEKPILELEDKIEEMRGMSGQLDIAVAISMLEAKVEELKHSIYSSLTRWQRVQLARHPDRPYTLDYISMICEDFIELHGDKCHGDDAAIVAGIGVIDGIRLVIIGHQKGHDTKENLVRNFGMPNPEGYRKALKMMHFAEKFKLPVLTFIDTPGAYPGIEAEERGQAEAIARNLFEMAKLRTPIINVVIGEGASGGALGIGMGDRLLVMENTWFSVISPESCSSILWKSWDFKEQAAEALQLASFDLLAQGIANDIIKEPLGGAHTNPEQASQMLKEKIIENFKELSSINIDILLHQRHNRYDKIGVWNN